MNRVDDRIAIVTGAAGGIGSATCRLLAAQGAQTEMQAAAARGAVEGMTQGQSALQRNGEMDLQGLRNVIMLRERYGVPQKKMGPPSKYYDPTWYDLARARR
jgi:UDP-glucose 4-epimerase